MKVRSVFFTYTSQLVENAISRNVEKSSKKFLDPIRRQMTSESQPVLYWPQLGLHLW